MAAQGKEFLPWLWPRRGQSREKSAGLTVVKAKTAQALFPNLDIFTIAFDGQIIDLFADLAEKLGTKGEANQSVLNAIAAFLKDQVTQRAQDEHFHSVSRCRHLHDDASRDSIGRNFRIAPCETWSI
jgi:hypothetical protein